MRTPTPRLRYAKQAVDQQFARWVMLHVESNPLPICTRLRVLIKGKRTDDGVRRGGGRDVRRLGIDATYTPAGGEPVTVRVTAWRPDATVAGLSPARSVIALQPWLTERKPRDRSCEEECRH
jgi:hypothetical protein